jgi:hypothetical protein
MRHAAFTTTFADCDVVEEIPAQEFDGSEFACIGDTDCHHPGGHVFKTSCGETMCIYCTKIAWR